MKIKQTFSWANLIERIYRFWKLIKWITIK